MSRSFVIAIPSINNRFSCKWYHTVRFNSALCDSLLKQPLSSFTTVRKQQQQQQLYPSKKFVDYTTIRFNSGNEKGNHDLFLKQMMDLKQEQEEIFGVSNNDNDDDDNITATTTTDDNNDDLIQLAQKAQALELQQQHKSMESDEDWEARSEEREAIYNFSQDEKDAWSTTTTTNNNNGNGEKKLSSSLMESIQKAREAQIIYENEQKQITNQKRQSWIQDTVSKYDNMSDLQSQQQNSSNGHNIESNNHTLFTHLNKSGETVSMVDVGAKVVTRRIARARSIVVFPPEVMEAFQFVTPSNENKETEIIGPKGPIFATAKIAGIMGAKRTSEFIPLCHPLPLEKVDVNIVLEGNKAIIECECRVTHKTGVEMEALQGATIAALTIYDMVKAVSHRVQIEKTELISKSGGKRNIGPE